MGRPRLRGGSRALPVSRLGEVSLVRRISAGDGDALGQLFHGHAAAVLAYLVSLTGDRVLAEDLLQETMIAAWRSASGFRADAAVRTWLLAIARGKARDASRRRSLSFVVDDASLIELADPADRPDDVVLARAGYEALAALIVCLRPLLREVVVLALVEDLPLADIARLLEVPVGTVKSRLSVARGELARLVREAQRDV